jgi:hypothetical protein
MFSIRVTEEKLAELANLPAGLLRELGFDPVSVYLTYWQRPSPVRDDAVTEAEVA